MLRGAKHAGGHRLSKHMSPRRASETSMPLVHQKILMCEGRKMCTRNCTKKLHGKSAREKVRETLHEKLHEKLYEKNLFHF